uniref:Major facilitator superfamily (MFS) profile domain-containing protein n=1 Tax=Clastoptera arizonana TaxID=38151 RepID=A0A1B6CNK1_9HEMI
MELCIGPYASYHTLIIINAVSPVLFLICSPWVPESPYFLLNNNKKDEAVKTMVWLRGGITTKSAETIVTDIQAFIDRSKTDKKSIKDLVATPATIKGLLMTIILLALQQLSGMPVMLIYTQQLFEQTGTNISASLSAILFGIVYVLGATAGPVFSKQCGFRMPLIVSCLFLFLCEFILGVYLYFDANGYEVSQFKFTVMVCVLGYAAIYNFALGPMPWAIMGEVLPPNVKGQASTIATFCCFLSAFLAVKMFPILSDILPNYVIFWMFASVNIIASVFTLLFVPNTKGMSLQQIQDKLASKKPTNGSEQT